MKLTWLADEMREWCGPAGFDVVDVAGWRTRGADFAARPLVVVAHHTATPADRPGDYPSLRIIRDGRSDLPGPLSQVGIGRAGTVYVIAAGKANHAGRGAWDGVTSSARTIGIEAESPGDGTWTAAQIAVYPLVCAALCAGLAAPASRVCGHREWALPAGRKPDPVGIGLDGLRRDTAALLARGPHRAPVKAQTTTPPVPLEESDDMRAQLVTADGVAIYAATPARTFHVRSQAHLHALRAAGLVLPGEVRRITAADLKELTA